MQSLYDGIQSGMTLFRPDSSSSALNAVVALDNTSNGVVVEQPSQTGLKALSAQFLAQNNYIQFLSALKTESIVFSAPSLVSLTPEQESDLFSKQIPVSQTTIAHQIETIEEYESGVMQSMSEAIDVLKCPMSEVKKRVIDTDMLMFEECLQLGQCHFYQDDQLILRSYYDPDSSVLLLKSTSPIQLMGSLQVKTLYLMGALTLKSAQIEVETECFVQSDVFDIQNTVIHCRSFIFSGTKIVLQQNIKLHAQMLLLKGEMHLQDTQIQAMYCRMQGKMLVKNLTIQADLYHLDASSAAIDHLNSQFYCWVLLEKNSHALSIVFEQSVISTTYLLSQQSCAFLSTQLITTKGACLSKGVFVFVETKWISSGAIHVLKNARFESKNVCEFILSDVIIDGEMTLEETTLKCDYLQQRHYLLLKNTTLEAKFLGNPVDTTTVLQERVTVIAENVDIHGTVSPEKSAGAGVQAFIIKYQFNFNKTASIDAPNGHLMIDGTIVHLSGVIKIDSLTIKGDTLNQHGGLTAHCATLHMRRYVCNKGQLISELLNIQGNFYNMMGRVYVKEKLSVCEGLMVVNMMGCMFANNVSSRNRFNANIGLLIPNFSADSKALLTYPNACSLAKNVAPIVITGGGCVVYLAEKTPDLVRMYVNYIKESLSQNTISPYERISVLTALLDNELKTLFEEFRIAFPKDQGHPPRPLMEITEEDWTLIEDDPDPQESTSAIAY